LDRVKIRLHPLGKVLTARKGSPLKDALHAYGVEFPCGGKGSCGKCAVRILEGTVGMDRHHRERIAELDLEPGWTLACLSRCESDLVVEVEQFEIIIQADETPFAFTPGKGLGIAVDLGTTTLVAQLVNLETGHILAVETALNPQKVYGNDLISRLESALAGASGEMTAMIRGKIGSMIRALCRGHDREVGRIVIVGNTVMQHFFCGSDIRPLSFYPFESPDLGLKQFTARGLGWGMDCGEVLFFPSIGSFVGSDILAGIRATGMHDHDDLTVLVDLGTNGEIVAGNRDGLLCASTAAGPAFEGARISRGMLATTGAISSVASLGDPGEVHVIGGTEPKGICGSGLIDAVGVMLKEGLIGAFGEILSGEGEIMVARPVSLTQKDIQEFQLAKAAIAAGLQILLHRLGARRADVSRIYIAGAFGTFINIEHVLRTGMLDFPAERIRQLGNTAIMGARMFLFPDDSSAAEITGKVKHVNLESENNFQDLFIEQMSFRAQDCL
jgi:uncharacterized 2Fe-2S/4Fe-4S cluster protein (DUF4445 family)